MFRKGFGEADAKQKETDHFKIVMRQIERLIIDFDRCERHVKCRVQSSVHQENVTSVQLKNCVVRQKESDLGKVLQSGNNHEARHEVRTSFMHQIQKELFMQSI